MDLVATDGQSKGGVFIRRQCTEDEQVANETL
jgi:hypothetical protein